MTNKKLSYLNKLNSFFSKNSIEDTEQTLTFLKSMLGFDFEEAIDLWEYISLKSKLIDKDLEYNTMITKDVFRLFCEKGVLKTYKVVLTNNNLLSLLFERSQNLLSDCSLEFITYLLLTSKIENAEVVFRLMLKNLNSDFGKNMKIIFENYMEALISKQDGQKNASIPKKVRTLLIFFIKKIKGEEKALLLQRINEIS